MDDSLKLPIMALYFLCIYLISYHQTSDIDMEIWFEEISGSTLKIGYFIKNNSQKNYSIRIDGISTISRVCNLTLYINENDSLPLHFENPFPGFLSTPIYKVIMPGKNISGRIPVNLTRLYELKNLSSLENTHKLTGKISFQLIYYEEKKFKKAKAYFEKKRIKDHEPISDTLRSNILYYKYP